MNQVDSEDAAFLFMEQADHPAHLGLVALYDPSSCEGHTIRFQHILKHMENRLKSAPVFQQKLKRVAADLDYPYWVEDVSFDLDYHVRHLAVPKPGDWRQFCIQVSRLHSRPLDIRRPLWELYVIEGLDHLNDLPEGSFALYLKVHHCAMDEFTAMELLESLHQTTANPLQHETGEIQIMRQAVRSPGTLDIAVQMISGNLLRSVKFSLQSIRHRRFIAKRLAKFGASALRSSLGSDPQSAEEHTRFAAPPGPARVFEAGFYDRNIIDSFIALVPGAEIHHALAVLCGEATRSYLAKKDGLQELKLSAQLQVNHRNAGAHALSGNKNALQHIELYTDVDNLLERLYAIVGSNSAASGIELEDKGHSLREVYENIPSPLLAIIGRLSKRELRSLEAGGSCGISTLNGPAQALYFLGAKMTRLTSVSPMYKGCGLMYSASQYAGKVAVSFTSGRDILPDPEKLRAALEETVLKIETLTREEATLS
jgi:diacylglycerol O-acyltransferase / wax synthase